MTIDSSKHGTTTTVSCVNFCGQVPQVTIFSWMLTTPCCLVVGLGSASVVMHTYLYYRLLFSVVIVNLAFEACCSLAAQPTAYTLVSRGDGCPSPNIGCRGKTNVSPQQLKQQQDKTHNLNRTACRLSVFRGCLLKEACEGYTASMYWKRSAFVPLKGLLVFHNEQQYASGLTR